MYRLEMPIASAVCSMLSTAFQRTYCYYFFPFRLLSSISRSAMPAIRFPSLIPKPFGFRTLSRRQAPFQTQRAAHNRIALQ
jgi:hypothetical protein